LSKQYASNESDLYISLKDNRNFLLTMNYLKSEQQPNACRYRPEVAHVFCWRESHSLFAALMRF
jgi:hypothetical protein